MRQLLYLIIQKTIAGVHVELPFHDRDAWQVAKDNLIHAA